MARRARPDPVAHEWQGAWPSCKYPRCERTTARTAGRADANILFCGLCSEPVCPEHARFHYSVAGSDWNPERQKGKAQRGA